MPFKARGFGNYASPCTALLMYGRPYCNHMTVCSCAKDGASKCKTAQYSPMKVANDGVIKSTGNDFTDADQLFAYMIEPVSPPKFFKWVLCALAVLIFRSLFYPCKWWLEYFVSICSLLFSVLTILLTRQSALQKLFNNCSACAQTSAKSEWTNKCRLMAHDTQSVCRHSQLLVV